MSLKNPVTPPGIDPGTVRLLYIYIYIMCSSALFCRLYWWISRYIYCKFELAACSTENYDAGQISVSARKCWW